MCWDRLGRYNRSISSTKQYCCFLVWGLGSASAITDTWDLDSKVTRFLFVSMNLGQLFWYCLCPWAMTTSDEVLVWLLLYILSYIFSKQNTLFPVPDPDCARSAEASKTQKRRFIDEIGRGRYLNKVVLQIHQYFTNNFLLTLLFWQSDFLGEKL